MLSFKKFISEVLTPQEIHSIQNWTRPKKSTKSTDHFFGEDNDEIIEPFTPSVKTETHKQVEHNIGQSISIEDYRKGMIDDRTRISSQISDPALRSKFKSDNSRAMKYNPNWTILVTRTKHGIAGQSSHNQSWGNNSCKNFNDGGSRAILPNEYKHGTVVSYLRDENGKELARATFQPYENEFGERIHRLSSLYGIKSPAFLKHCMEMENKLSQPTSNPLSTYKIHPEVLGDMFTSEETLHPHHEHDKHFLANELSKKIQNHTYTSNDIDTAEKWNFFEPLHKSQLSDSFLTKLKSGNFTVHDIDLAEKYGYYTPEHQKHLSDAITKIARKTEPHEYNDKNTDILRYASANDLLLPHHVDSLVDNIAHHRKIIPLYGLHLLTKDTILGRPIIQLLPHHHEILDKDEDEDYSLLNWEPDD